MWENTYIGQNCFYGTESVLKQHCVVCYYEGKQLRFCSFASPAVSLLETVYTNLRTKEYPWLVSFFTVFNVFIILESIFRHGIEEFSSPHRVSRFGKVPF